MACAISVITIGSGFVFERN